MGVGWPRRGRRPAAWALALLLPGACADGDGDCAEHIAAAEQFLDEPAHRACDSDADCKVVFTGCHTFPRGSCGQVALSVEAASSSSWRALSADLAECDADHCEHCDAQLVAQCIGGLCGGE